VCVCVCKGEDQKFISKYGVFQLRSAVYTSRRFPVLCELVVVLLKVPALKHAPCCSVWVAVEHLYLTEMYTSTLLRCIPLPY